MTTSALTEDRASPHLFGLAARRPRLAGVGHRVALQLGADHLVVRIGFILLGLTAGAGLVVYLVLWIVLPRATPDPTDRAPALRNDLGVIAITAAIMAAVTNLGVGEQLPATLLWAVGLVSFGLVLSSPGAEFDLARSRGGALVRIVAGGGFVVGGLAALLASTQTVSQLAYSALAALVLIGGLALVFGPWLTRALAMAERERAERIRAEERTDLAAHLHDSVLQTLNLIQNRANEPHVTAVLARQQERELRRWLQGHNGVVDDEADTSLRPALERVAAEVEEQYLSVVECIVVGDCELTPSVQALVAATREALINAGKFAETQLVSLYAEVEGEAVSAFIRDRGQGFDPAAVPPDRQGIRTSIHGRLERVGGSADIRSRPGEGTEVRIEVAR